MSELDAVGQYFYSRLSSDTASNPIVTVPPVTVGNTLDLLAPGGFHNERMETAPNGRYIIWSYQSALDVTGEGAIRVMVSAVYLVRVIDKTSDFDTLDPAANRMDAVLQKSFGAVPGYLVRGVVRERPYSLVERYVDIERRQLGGYYRVYIQASS